MIEACDAPRVLVGVVATKKKAISKKIPPSPVFRHEKPSEGTKEHLPLTIYLGT